MSIREVAARAGVSPATVSRVFTQPDTVAADTRRRVLEVAEELNYTPHPVARSLARGRTGNLGIVVPDMANSFSAVITKAVQQEARRDGYALFVAGSDELPQDEEQWARAMAPQVDGLLLRLAADAGRRAARAGRAGPPGAGTNRLLDGIPAVLTDATEATGHAVEHLHALGHRAIIYLAGPDGYSNDDAAARLPRACARLGVDPVGAGPVPGPLLGRRAGRRPGARHGRDGRRRLQRRGRGRRDQPARRPRRAGSRRPEHRRLRRHLAGRDGDAAADHRPAAGGHGRAAAAAGCCWTRSRAATAGPRRPARCPANSSSGRAPARTAAARDGRSRP